MEGYSIKKFKKRTGQKDVLEKYINYAVLRARKMHAYQ